MGKCGEGSPEEFVGQENEWGYVRQTSDRPVFAAGDEGGVKMVTTEPFYRITVLQKK